MKEYEFRFEDMFFKIKSSDTILYQLIFFMQNIKNKKLQSKIRDFISNIVYKKKKSEYNRG